MGLKKLGALAQLDSLLLCLKLEVNTVAIRDATRRDGAETEPKPARQARQAARDKQPGRPEQAAQTFALAQ